MSSGGVDCDLQGLYPYHNLNRYLGPEPKELTGASVTDEMAPNTPHVFIRRSRSKPSLKDICVWEFLNLTD